VPPGASSPDLSGATTDAAAAGVAGDIFEFFYRELRELAAGMLRDERRGHTLQPTALVNEMWLRLDGRVEGVGDREHFFSLAARAMRRVLTDHARSRGTQKRGGGAARVTLSEGSAHTASWDADLVGLSDSLEELARHHERAARVFELRAFGALPVPSVASLLGISESTAKRDWDFARMWLLRELDRGLARDAERLPHGRGDAR
jgi:RNA polymerase sigma factor (TIGR02999 family)